MPEPRRLPWTREQEIALNLIFAGRLTQDEIVQRLATPPSTDTLDGKSDGEGSNPVEGSSPQQSATMSANVLISSRTLRRWIAHPDFQQRLATMRASFAESIRAVTYADKARRVIALDELAEAARREFEARPLLVEVRPALRGEIRNEAFNEAAFNAFRGALDDIAKELGDRKNVQSVNATVDVSGRVAFYLPQPELPPADDELDSPDQANRRR